MNQLTKAAKTLAAKYNSTSLILRIAIGLVVGSVLHGSKNSATCLSAR